MASRSLLNPRAMLLVTPLVSSSITLWYSWDQEFFLRLLTRKVDTKKANEILPSYIDNMVYRGTAAVVGVIGVTFWSSAANIWINGALLRSRGTLAWYRWTALLALGHIAWVPGVAWKLKAVIEDKPEAEGSTTNVGVMERWLSVNMARMLTTDLTAWICAVVAVTATLRI